jgi:hypothetical protein
LVLFALVTLNITLIVGNASFWKNHLISVSNSGDFAGLLKLDLMQGDKQEFIHFFTLMGCVLLGF